MRIDCSPIPNKLELKSPILLAGPIGNAESMRSAKLPCAILLRQRTYERLAIYQRAIEFLPLAFLIAERVPQGHARLADQLRRAAMSIPLNIAEGYCKPDAPDRRRFYSIARGSAVECAAIFDLVRWLPGENAAPLAEGKNLLNQVVAMLARACD